MNSSEINLSALLTVAEAAEFLRTTSRAIYAMAGRGNLPGVVRVGKRLLVRRKDLVNSLFSKGRVSSREEHVDNN